MNTQATFTQQADQVLNYISTHCQGALAGITAAALSRSTGICERVLRKCIHQLRSLGHPIAAKPETGYFMATTPEELDLCCKFLRSRAMSSLMQEARMRKVAMPELLGQLKLLAQGEPDAN